MADTSYLSAFGATAAIVLNEVGEDVGERATAQANRFMNSGQYSAGKRTMNLLKTMKGVNWVTGVASAFASGFHAGMLLQCNYLE